VHQRKPECAKKAYHFAIAETGGLSCPTKGNFQGSPIENDFDPPVARPVASRLHLPYFSSSFFSLPSF
jgi:hypothetical protein